MLEHADLTTFALLTLCFAAALWDVATRRIPNVLTVTGFLLALALRGVSGPLPLAAGLLAAVLALALATPLVAAGGLGGGDAKLLAAAAAFVGPSALPTVLIVTACVGGALALLVAAHRRELGTTLSHCRALVTWVVPGGRRATPRPRTLGSPGALAVPYGVAIAAGAVAGWWA